MRYKYVTFYTPDFEIPALRLMKTAKMYGIDLYAKKIRKSRSWRGMVRLKPGFIYKCMEAFPKHQAIVWVDADSMFNKKHVDFMPKGADLVCRLWNRPKGTKEPIASVLAFKNSIKVRAIVKVWSDHTESLSAKTQRPEQRSLTKIMAETRGFKKREFPDKYVVPKWIGPHTDGYDKGVAHIWTTRWFGHDPVVSEKHAYIEKNQRETGIWTKENWEYPY